MIPKAIANRLLLPALLSALIACSPATDNVSDKGSDETIQDFSVTAATPYVTAKDSDNRLTKKQPLTFETFVQPDEHFPTIMLDPKKTFQTVIGFGGALTDASAETLAKLPEDKQEEVLTAYFDPERGIGYNFCRTHINSCDFSSESYAYSEVEGDVNLEHFSMARNYVIRNFKKFFP